MRSGFRFPNLPRLELAMIERGWTRPILARKAGISTATVSRLLRGHLVTVDTIERVSRAVVDNPAQTATAAFLAEGAA